MFKRLMVPSFSVLLLAIPASCQESKPERLQEHARLCQNLLKLSVLDFYLPSVDAEFGGYLQDVDAAGAFHGNEGKFLVFQGRQLWLFSVLAQENIERKKCLAAARSGFQFLRKHFYDKKRGGYFSKVSRTGEVIDRRKHAYLNSFALYGFVAYYEASRDAEALEVANELFDTLERHAYDTKFGGYQEFFYEDWTPITDSDEPRYVGAINTKTYNTHLHLLEAFSELQRVSPRPIVQERLSELVLINTSTVRHDTHECNIDGWTRDWSMIREPSNLRHSYGHDVECVWLVMRAMDALGRPRSTLKGWAKSTVDFSMQHGYDREHGGFYNSGALGADSDDRRKVWWVQSEALLSMLEMYRMTGEQCYLDAFAQTLRFCEQHFIAREQGGWWASRSVDGSADRNLSRTSQWQAGYHNGRALLYASRWLESLAQAIR